MALAGLLTVSYTATGAVSGLRAGPQLPPPIDPDTLAKQGSDANWSLRWLGNGKFQLFIQSTSGLGYIDSFDWVAGIGMKITAITSTSGGKCTLLNREIACVGKIKPPRLPCLPGGTMTVNFNATGDKPTDPKGVKVNYGDIGSYLAIKTITPVPYHIPSSLSNDT